MFNMTINLPIFFQKVIKTPKFSKSIFSFTCTESEKFFEFTQNQNALHRNPYCDEAIR